MTEPKLKKKNEPPNAILRYSGMAFTMAITIGGAVWLGQYLDEWNQTTTPWYTIIFALIGTVAAIYYVIKDLLKS